MFVLAEPGADEDAGAGRERDVAEIVILVFDLGRPVRREHVFKASSAAIPSAMSAVSGESHRRAADADAEVVTVPPGEPAVGLKQRRGPGVAKAAGDRSELVAVGGHE